MDLRGAVFCIRPTRKIPYAITLRKTEPDVGDIL